MMPMPQSPAPSMGAPEPSPMGGEPMPQEGGADVKAMLIQVLQKAKKMAEQNGIDFEELVDAMGEDETEEAPSPMSSPKPPSSMGQL